MKSVKILLGGHPLLGDDIEYLEAAQVEGLTAFLEAFLGDFTVLSGCVISITTVVTPNDTINWTAGWLYMQGELLQVDAGSAAYTFDNFWQIVETIDATGDRTYEDLTTQHPYVIRKATLSGTGGGPYEFNLAKYLKTYRIWTTIVYAGAWASAGAAAEYGPNVLGEITFRGAAHIASYNTGTDTVISTLPLALRPADTRILIAPALINGTRTFIHIEIDATGDIKPLGLASTDVATIYLDGLRFLTNQ